MSTRLARTAVALYPLAYRNRYGEELRALIEESEPGMRDALDLLGGAVKAHVCPPESVLRTLSPGDRLVSNIGGMVIAWLVFAVASFAFFNTVDGQSFSDAADGYWPLHASYLMLNLLKVLVAAAGIGLGFGIAMIAIGQREAKESSEPGIGLLRAWVALLAVPLGAILLTPHLFDPSLELVSSMIQLSLVAGAMLFVVIHASFRASAANSTCSPRRPCSSAFCWLAHLASPRLG